MFIQVACVLPEDQLRLRNKFGLFLACTGTFIALVFTSYVEKMLRKTELDDFLQDSKTTTASDYTVMFSIPKGMYEDFLDKEHEKWKMDPLRKGQSGPQSFKLWLQ